MNKDRLALAAALTLPALAALIAPRLGIGSAPGTVLASETGAAPTQAVPIIPLPKPTAQQLAALDRINQIGQAAGVASPFLEPVEDQVIPEDVPAEGPDWKDRLARQVNLSSVFGSARGDAAVINGKFFFKGNQVIEGVTIESIDVAARSVIVLTDDGARFQLDMPTRRDEPTPVTRLD